MTEATEARLEQIIELSRRVDSHATSMIRELAERALADERSRTTVTTRPHDWQFYANGTFCRRCGASIGSGSSCT